jgi:hypothetical protein
MGALGVERDALMCERDSLRDQIGQQKTTLEALGAERDTLVHDRHRLQDGIGQQRAAMEAFGAERDQLVKAVNLAQRALEKLTADRSWLYEERLKYHDAVLGKLTILQADCGSLGRSLTRLSNLPKNAIREEMTRNYYLNLLQDVLTGIVIKDESMAPGQKGYDEARRELGRDWPKIALTMIGKARMRNLRDAVETVLSDGVPGDLLEAGVWRGGACIYMRGILKAHGVTDRVVWVADSFAGLPPPNPQQYPADKDDRHHTFTPLVVPLREVRENFANFGLLDEQVRFLKGWFKTALPRARVERLALLRLDGDMYESTIQTLNAMYRKLSPGGFVIVDDYVLPGCKKAVDDFRAQHHIRSQLEEIDGAATYWRKLPNEQPLDSTPAKERRKQERKNDRKHEAR